MITKFVAENSEYDVIIVGAGPAGLAAGLYAGRMEIKALALERQAPGGELLNTLDIEDYPGFEHVTGQELSELMEKHARKFGLQIEYGTAEEIYKDGDDVITVTDVARYRSPAVIVTAGGQPKKLGVPGEAELAGRGVSYCAICDGAFFKDQPMAMVGGGDSAVEEGTFLTRYASKVYLIHRRDQFRAQAIAVAAAKKNPKMEFILDTVVDNIAGDERVRGIHVRNVKSGEERDLDVGAVFPFIGFQPNSNIFREHVEHDELGYLFGDENMQTNVPGIYVAGDLRHQLTKQITTAVGDGTTAAVAVSKLLAERRQGRAQAVATGGRPGSDGRPRTEASKEVEV